MRVLVAETAKALDEISAELQEALDETLEKACGCHEITIEREPASPFFVVRCNKGRVTRINVDYTTLTMIDNTALINRIAIQVANDHGLDAKSLAGDLWSALTRRDATATIKVR